MESSFLSYFQLCSLSGWCLRSRVSSCTTIKTRKKMITICRLEIIKTANSHLKVLKTLIKTKGCSWRSVRVNRLSLTKKVGRLNSCRAKEDLKTSWVSRTSHQVTKKPSSSTGALMSSRKHCQVCKSTQAIRIAICSLAQKTWMTF